MAAKKKTAKKRTKKPATKRTTRKASKKSAVKKGAAKKTAGSKRGRAAAGGSTTRVEELERLLDVMAKAGAVEVEFDEPTGSRLRVRLKDDSQPVPMMPYAPPPAAAAAAPVPAPAGVPAAETAAAAAPSAAADAPSGNTTTFTSPMVGTFYRSASPDSEPFVQEGSRIDAESTICILEAMKVMNEIKAELSGRIVRVLAQNGEPVEFGQDLFEIEVG